MSDFDPHDERDRGDDPERRTDGRTAPSGVVELGINVGLSPLTDLLGGILGGGGSPRPERDEWQIVEESDGAEAGESPRRAVSAADASVADADEYLVETRQQADELVVTAELPGVSEEDLAVGIDVQSSDLVIATEGRTIERISLPWSSTVAAKVRFNNGILEVRLEPAEDGERGGEAPGDSR